MKTRITALIVSIAMLAILLSGCGAVEPEATTVATTEAEPTTEPTTVPTEPPTALEQMGYKLWEHATKVNYYYGWEYDGVKLPVSIGMGGTYNDFQQAVKITEDSGRTVQELFAVPTNISVFEFPVSAFNSDIEWIKEKATPFCEYYNQTNDTELTFDEWITENRNMKLLYLQKVQYVDITETLANSGFEYARWTVGVGGLDVVNSLSGAWFNPGENYLSIGETSAEHIKCWKMEHDGDIIEILVRSYINTGGWYGENGTKLDLFSEMFVLVPEDFENICFRIQEWMTAEKFDNDMNDSTWETGNLLDDYADEGFRYHYIGIDSER